MDLDVSWEKMVTARKARLVTWMRAVGSRASVAKAEAWLGKQPTYLDLAARWDGLGPRERDAAWEQLIELYRAAAYATRPYCVRCGTCCSNAGPTLYAGDEGLLADRVVSPAQLRTYRAGEAVFSHWTNRPEVLERECVMVAPAPSGGCSFYEPGTQGCGIYDHRPAQCNAQKCWDTADANLLMGWPSLTRLELLGEGHPMAAAVAEHEDACSVVTLRAAAEGLAGGTPEAEAEIRGMIRRDREIRASLLAKKQTSQAALPFFLGRPLEALLPSLGFQIKTGWDGALQIERVED